MKPIDIPTFATKKELFAFLKQNKAALIQQRKAIAKRSDGIAFDGKLLTFKGETVKAASPAAASAGVLNVKAAMNTTNWLDSHLDVHMPGLWDKTLKESLMLMHLQEHNMAFDHIIADGNDLKVTTKTMTWRELGYNYAGVTEVLVFDSLVRKSRNGYMYDQYAQGYVKNHSVYMLYVKIVMAINEPDSTDYGAEYEAWQKYLPMIANQDFANEMGYFFGIFEAKLIEGSAVPRGSNITTPTISAEPAKTTPKSEPPRGTPSIYKLDLGTPAQGMRVGKLVINVNKL